MLRVRTNHARPGMVLAMPVYHPKRHDTLLLKAGVRLEAPTIARLRELNMRELWIQYPRLEAVAEYVSPAVHAARATITRQIADAFDGFSSTVDAELDYYSFRRAMNDLIGKLAEQPRAALFLSELVESGQPAVRHATNVSYICVLIGLKLEFYLVRERAKLSAVNARDVSNLGVAAMLHDIGMLRLPPEVLERWNAEHDETDPAWREHVRIGYELVRGELEPSAAAAILHHHQRYNGSGFPARMVFGGGEEELSGSDIHVFARIIAAADLFDRLINPAHAPGADSAGLPSIPTVRALNMMRQPPFVEWIDPIVFSGLLAVVPAYPPGSLVCLSNGVTGVVTSWTPENPCRPTVAEIGDLDDCSDCDDSGAVYDLTEHQDLEIVEVDGEDVRADNFYPDSARQFDLAAIERAMMNRAAEDEAEERRRRAG